MARARTRRLRAKLVHYEQSEAYRSCRRWYGRSCHSLLAVAHVIRELEPDADIAVVGTVVGLEHDLVPQAGFELETIEKVPFPRRPNMAALKFPAQWKAETAKVRDILTRHEAQVVVGFGGYTSAPVYAAAHKMGIPSRCMSRMPVPEWPTNWELAGRPLSAPPMRKPA